MGQFKIRGAEFEELNEAVRGADTEERRELYRTGQFPRADKVNDLDTRYRWDLFWAVLGGEILRRHAPEGLPYWNDAHIDTALRRIVSPL